MHRSAFSALAAAFIALPSSLSAQGTPAPLPVSPDQEVRIMAPIHGLIRPTIATVVDVRGDTLVVQTAGYDPRSTEPMMMQREMPIFEVSRLEVPMGPRSKVRGVAIGSLVGTGLGLIAAAVDRRQSITVAESECPHDEFTCASTWNPYTVERKMTIVLGGTLVGAAAGYLLPGRRWRDVLPVAPQAAVNADGSVLVAGTVEF